MSELRHYLMISPLKEVRKGNERARGKVHKNEKENREVEHLLHNDNIYISYVGAPTLLQILSSFAGWEEQISEKRMVNISLTYKTGLFTLQPYGNHVLSKIRESAETLKI